MSSDFDTQSPNAGEPTARASATTTTPTTFDRATLLRRGLATGGALALAAGGLPELAGASTSSAGRFAGTSLNLAAYSTPKPVLSQLISAFQKTSDGDGVNISASYGGSSAQAAAVVAGQPADVVILSTGTDMNLLVDNHVISPKWDHQSYDGVVWNSVVVFGLRNGNPKHIKGWPDLLKPGVGVLIPNPFTAGIAKWDILSAYVAERKLGKTDKQAIAFVKKLYNHVVSQDSSGSNATNTFISGRGDALITFESEAINGKIPFVIPRQTMKIEIYGAVTTQSKASAVGNAFLRYLKTAPAQAILGQNGYRPVNKQVAAQFQSKFPVRPGETTIAAKFVGGWRTADKKWFDPNHSVMQRIEESLGVSTSG